eukprot:COSAG02_NODE_64793_length_259_cov_1.075000_2_plen_22_part_01
MMTGTYTHLHPGDALRKVGGVT